MSPNQFSIICPINNFLIYENVLLKSVFKSANVNNIKADCTNKTLGSTSNRYAYDEQFADNCIDRNKVIINNRGPNKSLIPNSAECRIYAVEQVKFENNLVTPRIPLFSLMLFLFCLFFIFLESKIFIKSK